MRTIVYISSIIFLIGLYGCSGSSGSGSTTISTPAQLVILVYDISISFDHLAHLDSSHLKSIFHNTSLQGGGRVYSLFIKERSDQQEPLGFDIPKLHLLARSGNAYQQTNRQKYNNRVLSVLSTSEEVFSEQLSQSLLVPRAAKWSDVENSLLLTATILSNSIYADHQKKVLILSDLIQDLPPIHGIDKMEAVPFGKDVAVYLVRPSGKVNVAEIISGPAPQVFATVEDAINNMFNLQ
jgi:hypothetical protein